MRSHRDSMASRYEITIVLACLMGISVLVSSPSRADDTKPAVEGKKPAEGSPSQTGRKTITPQEKLQFDQDKAQAHMRELEDRMFQLANLIRNTQPDNAARLLMGVRRARDELIVERMKQVSELISELDLTDATAEQKEIIARLEELKKLLLSTDLNLEMKLEQLRKIREARAALGQLIDKEQKQNQQTDAAAKNNASDKQQNKALAANEKRNQRTGEDLQQLIKQIGSNCEEAANSVGAAGKKMGSAGQKLGQSQPKEAGEDQKKALEDLAKADEQLAEEERKLQEELAATARQRVMEQIRQMIVQQIKIRETTEKLVPRVREQNENALLAVRRLVVAEDRIVDLCQQAIGVTEMVQFSIVLPMALDSVKSQMLAVSEQLAKSHADERLVEDQRQIETELQMLLEALEAAAKSSQSKKEGQGKCKGCQGDQFKLLSEVKMLYLMEAALHRETRQLQADQLAGQPVDPARQLTLSKKQEQIRIMTERLHTMTCPHCLAGGE
ncbi:MAG: hypothetical protein ACKVT0_16450 [Planctomycetaceae bacterium]